MITKKWENCSYKKRGSKHYSKNKEFFLRNIPKKEGKILDLGCGDGSLIKDLKTSTSEVFGLDINKSNLKRIRGFNVVAADLERGLPFKSRTFDLVVSNQVIEHIDRIDNLLDEIHRILKDGGEAFIMTVNLTAIHNLGLMIFGKQPTGLHVSKVQIGNPLKGVETHGHKKAFTIPGLVDLFNFHGFKIKRKLGYGFYFMPNVISSFLSKIIPFYSIYIGVISEKVPHKGRKRS